MKNKKDFQILLPPAVSIIVPVLNEQETINRTIANLAGACRGFNVEIIIVDGDPAGSTINRVGRNQVITLVAPAGRASQMNAGAKAAKGGILVFVHADTHLPPGAIGDVLRARKRPEIAAGAFFLGIDSPKRIFRLIEILANVRCRLTRIAYGDQAVFVKKRVFEQIGGFAHIPIMEDIGIMQRLKKNRLAIRLIPKPVKTSARRWEKEGLIYGIVRNNLLSCLYYAGVKPSVLRRFYK